MSDPNTCERCGGYVEGPIWDNEAGSMLLCNDCYADYASGDCGLDDWEEES